MTAYPMSPIGKIHSPFKEKFGIPRQSGLIQHAYGEIVFYEPYHQADAFIGLDGFSHIWVTFIFHKNIPSDNTTWRPLIRPPRLGGNKKLGVFASRSSFRPNNIGMSALRLISVNNVKGKTSLTIECPDMMDQTPVLDIKPYIHYSDSISNATSSFASEAPKIILSVTFENNVTEQLGTFPSTPYGNIKALITETLGLDPRPAYKMNNDNKTYGVRLYDLDIKWQVSGNVANVIDIKKIK